MPKRLDGLPYQCKPINCKQCGELVEHPTSTGQKFCRRCASKENISERAKTRYKHYKSKGVCPHHPNRSVINGRSVCLECVINHRLTGYKQAAEWHVTDELATKKMYEPCYYCGAVAPITGHGLDKVDPTKGYIVNNIVACCWDTKSDERRCNLKKNACTIQIAQKMIEHQLEICDEPTIAWFNLLQVRK